MSGVAPSPNAPESNVLSGAVEGQEFIVTAATLFALLQVSDSDGAGYQFFITAAAGELRRMAVLWPAPCLVKRTVLVGCLRMAEMGTSMRCRSS